MIFESITTIEIRAEIINLSQNKIIYNSLNKGLSTPIAISIIVLVIVIVLAGGIFAWQYRVMLKGVVSTDKGMLTPETEKIQEIIIPSLAKKAAIAELPRASLGVPEWKKATVSPSDPIIFYDLTGQPTCYLFTITVNGEYAGFMSISARYEFFPVMEYTTGELPIEKLNEALASAQEAILLSSVKPEPQLLFFDLSSGYLAKFESKDTKNNVTVSLMSLFTYTDKELSDLQKNFELAGQGDHSRERAAWKAIEEKN